MLATIFAILKHAYFATSSMRTIILSDTHLGPRFNQRKLNHLLAIVQHADRIILLGDLWEGYVWSFDEFIHSRWQPLLEAFAQRETIYIAGNHDPIHAMDDRAQYFCQYLGIEYQLTLPSGASLYLTHGDSIMPPWDERWPVLKKQSLRALGSAANKVHKSLFGWHWMRTNNEVNQKFKHWIQRRKLDQDWLIVGHSHFPEIDRASRLANSGFIGSGYSSYLLADQHGLDLIKSRY